MPLEFDYQIVDTCVDDTPLAAAAAAKSTKSPKKVFQFIPGLDNIRGLAVLFVLLQHATYGVIKGGLIGVVLFFVLSGFIITSLLQTEYANYGKISIKRFYFRRALRLFPPLLIGIVLANAFWFYNSAEYPTADRTLATVASLFYFVNLLPQQYSGSLVHLWSLSVEEHFYLFWPLITAFFIFKFSRRNQIIALAVLILLASAFRLWQGNYDIQFFNGFIIIDPLRFTLCSVEGILTGALMAVILSKPAFQNFSLSKKLRGWVIAIFCLVFCCLLVKLDTGFIYQNGGFLLLDIFCAAAIFVAIKSPAHFMFSNKILKWMGTRSYGIYVYHYIIFAAFEHFRYKSSISNFIIITLLRVGISFLFAEASFRYIERPLSRFKNGWGRRGMKVL
jgi:peptidoglycan/LPS O-acetylase OafA/YrhL